MYPRPLQINIYYDDAEVCNPLGSKSKVHKLGKHFLSIHNISASDFFYYILGNLHPKYRSSLRTVQLLAVAESSVIEKYGSNVILKSFIDDVKELEQVNIF